MSHRNIPSGTIQYIIHKTDLYCGATYLFGPHPRDWTLEHPVSGLLLFFLLNGRCCVVRFGVGQGIALHISPAAMTSTRLGYLVSAFPVHSTSVLRPKISPIFKNVNVSVNLNVTGGTNAFCFSLDLTLGTGP